MTPKRIQRKRARGWKMPPDTIYVGRPTKWGNPFRVGHKGLSAQDCVNLYKTVAQKLPVHELKGKNLACWCKIVDKTGKYTPCHADVLLSVANNKTIEDVKENNIKVGDDRG